MRVWYGVSVMPFCSAPLYVLCGFALTFRSELANAAYLRIAPTVDGSDRFYGLGEWGDGVEQRGKLRPMQLEVDTTIESSNNAAPVERKTITSR